MKKTLFLPTLLISEVYHPYCLEKGSTANLIEKLAEDGFYRAVEIGYGYDPQERKQILTSAEKNNLIVTQWLTSLINEKNLDVSAIEPQKRRESVKQIKESLYAAAECGASNIAFISGPDPGVQLRKDAAESFYQTLSEICEEATQYNMKVLVEPLDREAHKKRFLGPTSEAVSLFARVRESYPNVGFAFDTAHAALNGENIYEALELAKPYINQLHFSNAVLDVEHELYGDHHMPIGRPGFLDSETISSILWKVEELEIQADQGLRVSIEVRGTEKQELHTNEKAVRAVLEKALFTVGIQG
ncbi:sugar phosphate isomerase/epimerase family protein [Metabacillus herbersteinensis]|uniref:Sugar phosphate isomerase/epimerase family protein n=1 Tax=Metabacillus herbersteinensis TaxID=283816 RepID=A0ABV6GJT9_9BACI